MSLLKACTKLLVRGYYRRVEARGLEHLPAEGPVVLAPNHPNSLFDPLALGSVTGRRIHFVAKHTLFTFPLKPILSWAGVIPVKRKQDSSEGASRDQNLQAFEACFAVLRQGGVVGIFPEGITHDQPRLAPVKTGPARIALGVDGVTVVPVALHFPMKSAFRSDAVVVFGEPLRADDWKDEANPREAVRKLTAEIEARLKALLPQVPEGEEALVSTIAEIYTDGRPTAEEDLVRAREVASAVSRLKEKESALARKVLRYRKLLDRLGVSDRTLGRSLSPAALREEGLPRTAVLFLGFPLALYGLLNHVLAGRLAALSVRLFARKEDRTMVALQRMLGGLVGIPLTYALQGWAVHRAFGFHVLVGYLCSLPATGLFAWWWLRKLAGAALTLEEGAVLLTHRWLLFGLRRRRAALKRDLERARLG